MKIFTKLFHLFSNKKFKIVAAAPRMQQYQNTNSNYSRLRMLASEGNCTTRRTIMMMMMIATEISKLNLKFKTRILCTLREPLVASHFSQFGSFNLNWKRVKRGTSWVLVDLVQQNVKFLSFYFLLHFVSTSQCVFFLLLLLMIFCNFTSVFKLEQYFFFIFFLKNFPHSISIQNRKA